MGIEDKADAAKDKVKAALKKPLVSTPVISRLKVKAKAKTCKAKSKTPLIRSKIPPMISKTRPKDSLTA